MFHWVPYAMVRLTVFLIGGILLAIYQPDLLTEIHAWIGLGICLVAFATVTAFSSGTKSKSLAGTMGLASLFMVGYLNVLLHTDSRNSDHFIHVVKPIHYYQVVINRFAEEKENSWKIEGRIDRVQEDDRWLHRSGKVVLYFPKSDFAKPFQYGDVLLVKGAPQLLSPPANPGEFDYKRFLTFRKIYHQHFLRKEHVKWLSNDPPNVVMDYSIKARLWADQHIRAVVSGDREKAIAAALVLGVTDGLDNELLRAYAATGAMHVLAVSGLHVGIIYWIILLLLKPLNTSRSGKWSIAVISLVTLWTYAFITGLSPSVLRAVTMFTFMALAKPWGRTTNIYNTLAAAAFCLLIYEPYLVMSVGFQLSFIAVIGIVFIQPLIYPWWQPANRLLDEVWKITSVSLAAQLATFALGLLYFYQFPNYFLFSNLLVIPTSFVVLVAGLAVLAFNFFSPLVLLAGFILEWSIKIMNYVVFAVESLPYALMENIYISTFQCWMLMAVTLFLILLFTTRKFFLLPLSVLCALAFSAEEWQRLLEDSAQEKWVVYKVNGHTAMDFINGETAVFHTDSLLRNDAERLRFHIRPNRLKSGITRVSNEVNFKREWDGYTLFVWKNKKVLWIHRPKAVLPTHLKVDWLVVSNNAIRNWKDLAERIECQQVILDSSNSIYFSNRAMKELGALQKPFYSVLHKGAFEYSL